MYQVIAPAVEFEGGVRRSFFEVEEGVVDGVVIGDLFEGSGAEEGGHLSVEGSCEKPVDIVVTVVGENEAAVLDVVAEVRAFLAVELDEFVAADIGEGVVKDVGAVEVEDFFLEVDGYGGVLDEGIQQIGGHALVGIPVAGLVAKAHEGKFVLGGFVLRGGVHRSCNFFKVAVFIFNFLIRHDKKLPDNRVSQFVAT